ncbi:MAG: winged helix-turn-helix domain-containing protein [Actinomycetota bacterium]
MANHDAPMRGRVVLGPAAPELRRRLSPTVWVVLEEMVEQSTVEGDLTVARVSVRSLAASLGLAKDTVHRATTRLQELGVVEVRQSRTTAGGFGSGSYRLSIPSAVMSITSTSSPVADRLAPMSSVSAHAQSDSSDQLSLFFES